MQEPKPTPLSPQQVGLLEKLAEKHRHWDRLLGLGKPGARQLRAIIRSDLATYERQLERCRPCTACAGTGRGSATDPIIPCAACRGSGLHKAEAPE